MASFELLMPIAGAFQHLGQTLTSARRLNDIILAEPEVQFPTASTQHSCQFDIEFSDVTFHYPDSSQDVLRGVNLHIPVGHRVAIVGQTGSGKSTLMQLLSRYWDPQQGSVSIAGTNLTAWNESELRQAISVVSQRVDVLNGTLRDNLAMANPSANDEQLAHALTQVGLHTLLDDLGLDAWLGEGGRQLSGGEKRRIGIARALLHNGSILLLDEPTEGLDKQTEQQILALFKQHFAHKTVLFITHRLVELETMDAICLIEQGEIVEYGSHQALLAKQGRYFQLQQTL
jgi:ATP-binding cassette subfamily C protein CydC